MDKTTIRVIPEVRIKLQILKQEKGFANVSEVILYLIKKEGVKKE